MEAFLHALNFVFPFKRSIIPDQQVLASTDHLAEQGLGDLLKERIPDVIAQAKSTMFTTLKEHTSVDPEKITWLSEVPIAQHWKSSLALEVASSDAELESVLSSQTLVIQETETNISSKPQNISEFAQAIITTPRFSVSWGKLENQRLNLETAWKIANSKLAPLLSEAQFNFVPKSDLIQVVETFTLQEKIAINIVLLRGGYYNFDTEGTKFSLENFNKYIGQLSSRVDLVGYYPITDDSEVTKVIQQLETKKHNFLLDSASLNQEDMKLYGKMMELIAQEKLGVTIVEIKVSTVAEKPAESKQDQREKEPAKKENS